MVSAGVEALPSNGSAPRPLIVTEAAFAVVQFNVDMPPAVMESGLALKVMICGMTMLALTVTIAVAVTVPPEPLAVKV